MAQFASKEIELQQGTLEVHLHFRGTLHKYKAHHGLVTKPPVFPAALQAHFYFYFL
jgi:hypothetical protein